MDCMMDSFQQLEMKWHYLKISGYVIKNDDNEMLDMQTVLTASTYEPLGDSDSIVTNSHFMEAPISQSKVQHVGRD